VGSTGTTKQFPNWSNNPKCKATRIQQTPKQAQFVNHKNHNISKHNTNDQPQDPEIQQTTHHEILDPLKMIMRYKNLKNSTHPRTWNQLFTQLWRDLALNPGVMYSNLLCILSIIYSIVGLFESQIYFASLERWTSARHLETSGPGLPVIVCPTTDECLFARSVFKMSL
jgi:hypothetical protein